jgi:hypothetical protein
MLDKVENRVPYGVNFRPGFSFFSGHVRFEGLSTPINRSIHYTGTVDLRPFGIDAIVHMHLRRGKTRGSHKLELLATGGKSLRQMRALARRIFDVDPDELPLMRVDFASDLDGVTLSQAFGSIRVKYKRSTDSIGELDFETVGKQRLEYFRYGKSPNCVRVYDKPAECMARFLGLVKRCNVSRYLSKYLTKDLLLSAPKGTRRITTARGIKLFPKYESGIVWEFLRDSIWLLLASHRAAAIQRQSDPSESILVHLDEENFVKAFELVVDA